MLAPVVALLAPHARALAAQYWFAANDPVVQADRHSSQPADYMELFAPDAPWQTGASRLAMLKISTQFLNRGTDEQLGTMLGWLRARHIGLAMEIGPLVWTQRCGRGIDSYIASGQIERMLGRLKRLGGMLAAVDMAEPVWYGHELTWRKQNAPQAIPCADSVEVVAQQAAASAAVIWSIFPDARVGDIEPIGDRINPAVLVADIVEFGTAFERYAHRPLAFLHLDIAWRTGWQSTVAPLAAQIRAQGTRFGPIIDGDVQDSTSQAWVRTSLRHLDEFLGVLGGMPDDVEVQSWSPLPANVLPESDSGSLSYLLAASQRRVR